MSVKILHTADLHIGAMESFLGERAKERRTETLMTFERIIDLARNEGVKYLLIAGDLFDFNGLEQYLVNAVFNAIGSAKDINFIYSAGNHDPLDVNSPFLKVQIPENLFVMGTADTCFKFQDDGVCFYGRSFKDIYCENCGKFTLTPEKDYINIMCIHGELTNDTATGYNPLTPEFITSSGMDYIALGHIHKRSEIGRLGGVSFAYCGCPEGQGFDESGEKGVLLGEISKGSADLKFVKTAYRTHERLSFNVENLNTSSEIADAVLNEISSKYGEGYQNGLYRIVLKGYVNDTAEISADSICARLKSVLYFAKVKDETEEKVDLELLRKEPSLKGVFTDTVLKKIENATEESEKEALKYALKLGLKSFSKEVTFNEN